MTPVGGPYLTEERNVTDAERVEAETLWAALSEGPIHPDVTAADLPELRRVVFALTD